MSLTDPSDRLGQLKVHDIMIPLEQYPQVSTKATLRDAVRVMEKAELNVAGRRSLPRVLLVCDADGGIAGLVGRRDALHGLEPRFLDSEPLKYRRKPFDVGFDPHLSEMNAERVIEGIRKRAARPVTDVMRPIKGAIDHQDSIITAFYEMTSLGVPMLPVERDGQTIGVVRTVEVFSELARLVE